MQTNIRCQDCGKLLAKKTPGYTRLLKETVQAEIESHAVDENTTRLEIKCPRCKRINDITV